MTRDEAWKLADHWIASWNAHDLDLIMTHYEDAIELTSPVVAQLLGTLGRWHELWRTTVLSRRDPAHAREKSQLINALAVTVACWREADITNRGKPTSDHFRAALSLGQLILRL